MDVRLMDNRAGNTIMDRGKAFHNPRFTTGGSEI